jgi:hypothetical protein
MRSGLASLLPAIGIGAGLGIGTGVLAGACGGAAGEPPLVTPAPVPEPADESAESAGSIEPAAEPAAEAVSPEETEALAAVARLTTEPRVAYYLPDDRSVVTAADLDKEGNRPLAARLAGRQLIALTFTHWPDGKRAVALDDPKVKVTWQRSGKLSAAVGKKRIAIGQLKGEGKVVPRPAGLFSSPESPAVLVLVRREPDPPEVLRFDLPASAR